MHTKTSFWGMGVRSTTGLYIASTHQMYILKGYEDDEWVFQHELHHHIWYDLLTARERNEFNVLHATTTPPTAYAATSVTEDFADTGALYAEAPYDPSIAERKQFMDAVYTRLVGRHR